MLQLSGWPGWLQRPWQAPPLRWSMLQLPSGFWCCESQTSARSTASSVCLLPPREATSALRAAEPRPSSPLPENLPISLVRSVTGDFSRPISLSSTLAAGAGASLIVVTSTPVASATTPTASTTSVSFASTSTGVTSLTSSISSVALSLTAIKSLISSLIFSGCMITARIISNTAWTTTLVSQLGATCVQGSVPTFSSSSISSRIEVGSALTAEAPDCLPTVGLAGAPADAGPAPFDCGCAAGFVCSATALTGADPLRGVAAGPVGDFKGAATGTAVRGNFDSVDRFSDDGSLAIVDFPTSASDFHRPSRNPTAPVTGGWPRLLASPRPPENEPGFCLRLPAANLYPTQFSVERKQIALRRQGDSLCRRRLLSATRRKSRNDRRQESPPTAANATQFEQLNGPARRPPGLAEIALARVESSLYRARHRTD